MSPRGCSLYYFLRRRCPPLPKHAKDQLVEVIGTTTVTPIESYSVGGQIACSLRSGDLNRLWRFGANEKGAVTDRTMSGR